jgi:hypothetical protein
MDVIEILKARTVTICFLLMYSTEAFEYVLSHKKYRNTSDNTEAQLVSTVILTSCWKEHF